MKIKYSRLRLLNYFFYVFHTSLIFFILAGWIWEPLRKLHLLVILLTLFSWIIIGLWKGLGYCICTDFHWKVRKAMGYQDSNDSYIHFLLLKLTRMHFPPKLVSTLTTLGLIVCSLLSIWLNLFT